MCIDRNLEAPQTPISGSDDEAPRRSSVAQATAVALTGEEEDATDREQAPPRRKPGGYSSRIEQILYENPELPILITDAGKSLESGGRYIVYTIRTGVWSSAVYWELF